MWWNNLTYLLCIFVCFCTISNNTPVKTKKQKSPVILVPGDGGSQFEAKLNKPAARHIWCTKHTDTWFPLWLNLELMAPYILDCFVDNMRLVYDNVTRTTKNAPGVMTRQPGFGNTSTVEWLDSSQLGPTSYFNKIADGLVKTGLKRNVGIKGAPYDFRKAPNEMRQFINDLKNLVETTYKENSNQKVILVGHSMGNPYILYLLYGQSQKWKDKYIKSFVSLAGPWGGAVKTLRLMASGDNLGVFVVNPLSVRLEQRSMTSTAWLLPYDTFWNESEVLVTGPKDNYTVKDYQRYFRDINFPTGWLMRQDTENLIKKFDHPGVEVHCLHGVNVSTPAGFHYKESQWYDNQPDVVFGNGDGTVNLRSLHGCLRWQNKRGKPQIFHKEFPGVDHMTILNYKSTVDYVVQMVNKEGRSANVS